MRQADESIHRTDRPMPALHRRPMLAHGALGSNKERAAPHVPGRPQPRL